MLYLELFLTFFKIGLFTIGGGYAMLPLIQADVQAKGWMTAKELVNFIAVSESTPGPFAVNVSTYVGAELAGLPGAFCATLGVVLPSFLIILLVARFYAAFRSSAIVSGAMGGLRPAVIGMIGAAVGLGGADGVPAGGIGGGDGVSPGLLSGHLRPDGGPDPQEAPSHRHHPAVRPARHRHRLPAAGVTPARRPGTGRRAFFFGRTKDFLKAGFPLLTWSALQVLSFS